MHSVGAADEGRGEIADCDLNKGRCDVAIILLVKK
tara:strand:+ start:349 stop:453 length:105 start_codon:yes stop_codon:yes gene_type:complete